VGFFLCAFFVVDVLAEGVVGCLCLVRGFFAFVFKEIQHEQPSAKTHGPRVPHVAVSVQLQGLRRSFA